MKTRPKPTRQQMNIVADAVAAEIVEIFNQEVATTIIAVARHFGLGEKRMKRFLKDLEEVKSEFARYSYDGICVEKIIEALEPLGVDYKKDIAYDAMPTEYAARQSRKRHATAVSIGEAYKVNKEFKAFSEFVKHGEKNGKN